MYHRHGDDAPERPQNLLPPVEQPRGLTYVFQTWSGRLILLNLIIFAAEVFLSPKANINSIPLDTLVSLGAKEPVRLAQGEYWRLFTPMFLHGNLLHLLFNNWALFAVAYQMEALLGPRKFLLLYFLAGVGGNIFSSLWSLNISVGASGSLFGILGCAWFFERTIHRRLSEETGYKLKAGAYTVMVVANILFGFIIPQIDNAAHMGGLLVGITMAYVLLRITPNRLVALQQTRARIVLGLVAMTFIAAATVGVQKSFVSWKLAQGIDKAEVVAERYYLLNRMLELEPENMLRVWQHFRLALKLSDFTRAKRDLTLLSKDQDFETKIRRILEELGPEESYAQTWLENELQMSSL